MTAMDKSALRPIAAARRAEAAAQRPDAGAALARIAPPLAARCVAAYRPIRSEIDPMPLARTIVARGAALALPVVEPGGIVFRAWAEGEPLARHGRFAIEEPAGAMVEPDLVLVPLLAFTRAGGRLGYGAGHYDRYLAAHPGVRTVGVAFAAQELQELPLEPHDQRLDAIVTEEAFIAVKEGVCVSSS